MKFKATYTTYVDIPPEDVPLDDAYPDFIDNYVAVESWKKIEQGEFECEYVEDYEQTIR